MHAGRITTLPPALAGGANLIALPENLFTQDVKCILLHGAARKPQLVPDTVLRDHEPLLVRLHDHRQCYRKVASEEVGELPRVFRDREN